MTSYVIKHFIDANKQQIMLEDYYVLLLNIIFTKGIGNVV